MVPASYWCPGCRGSAGNSPYWPGYYPGYYQYPNANPYSNNYYYHNPYYASGYPYGPSYPSMGGAIDLPNLPDGGVDEVPGDGDEVHGSALPAHRDRFWLSADYDGSWIKSWRLPLPLVTFGSPTSATPGALGQPGTTSTFDSANFGMFQGVRLDGGYYLGDGGCLAVEMSGLVALPNHVRFAASSDASGNPIIGRPIFNTATGAPGVILDSLPLPLVGASAGSVSVDARSEFLGAEMNLRSSFHPWDHFRLDGLIGFRFLRLAESLTIRDQVTPLNSGIEFLGSPVSVGSELTDVDSFRTINHFYGGQLGADLRWENNWLMVSAFGKVALGTSSEEADINGSTTLSSPSGVVTAGGGALALPSNIGVHTRTILAYVPEVGMTVGVNVAPCCRLTVGYSFLYWSSVLRPGAQINPVVNPSQIPTSTTFGTPGGPLAPSYHFNGESFWTHSVLVGVDFHY
jgi:hypothetical protein